MLKIVQRSRDLRLDLASGSWLASHQKLHTCQACQKLKCHASWSTTGQKVKTGRLVTSRLEPTTRQVARQSRQLALFWKTDSSHSSLTLVYIPLVPTKCGELLERIWERNPRKKQDWLIHNLHIETLQIPLLSPSSLWHSWEVHYQNLFSPYPYLWEDCLVLWEAVKKGPISYWLMLWSVAESGKLKKK